PVRGTAEGQPPAGGAGEDRGRGRSRHLRHGPASRRHRARTAPPEALGFSTRKTRRGTERSRKKRFVSPPLHSPRPLCSFSACSAFKGSTAFRTLEQRG